MRILRLHPISLSGSRLETIYLYPIFPATGSESAQRNDFAARTSLFTRRGTELAIFLFIVLYLLKLGL
jgi:hypothetical protein